MDHYQILKVHTGAKQVEIDRAYQKLVKEARYDQSINRKLVEAAYRTLSDATQRALYDATMAERSKRNAVSQKIRQKEIKEENRPKRLAVMLGIVFFLFAGYYVYRFGYAIKSFDAGDELYFKESGKYFGKLIQKEDHQFGRLKKAGYLIKTEDDEDVWYPAKDVKSLCEEH